MKRVRRSWLLITAILVLGAALYGVLGATSAGASMHTSKTVKMLDYKFMPTSITISKGSTIVWKNPSNATHDAKDAGVFNSGAVAPNGTYSHRFGKAGTYHYVCSYHKNMGMKGTITVTG